jgi:hypothetical protein
MPETASITPSLGGRVWIKSVRHPFLNTAVTVSDYGDIDSASRSAAFPVAGRSLPTAVTDLHLGRDHLLDVIVDNDADDARLDLMLRTSEVLFIHRPNAAASGLEGNLLLPGSMHVLVGTVRKHRLGGVSRYQRYTLPLTEVNPPGPDVVGGTLTWGTVMALYGSWEAVVAAHSSWADLLETVGSPEDLVVL